MLLTFFVERAANSTFLVNDPIAELAEKAPQDIDEYKSQMEKKKEVLAADKKTETMKRLMKALGDT